MSNGILNAIEVWEGTSRIFKLGGFDNNLTSEERKSAVRDTLSKVGKLDDTLNLVWSELLYEARELRYYKDWGHKKFKDYADKELGLGSQKANALASIYEVYVVKCMIPAEICCNLSFTKAFICKSYLVKHPEDWKNVVEAMETMSCAALRDWVAAKNGNAPKEKLAITIKFADQDSLDLWEQVVAWVGENTGVEEVAPGYVVSVLCQEFLSGRLDEPGIRDIIGSLDRAVNMVERAYGVRLAVDHTKTEDSLCSASRNGEFATVGSGVSA